MDKEKEVSKPETPAEAAPEVFESLNPVKPLFGIFPGLSGEDARAWRKQMKQFLRDREDQRENPDHI
jgi:hypothetical protein